MAYLFWSFAALWMGIFVCLCALTRESRALQREVAMLREQLRRETSPTSLPVGPRGDCV